MSNLPLSFRERNILELGEEEALRFFESLESAVPVSVRYNSEKIVRDEDLESVEWCKDGVYMEDRPIFTLDPLFHAGSYYPQEASSMFIEQFVSKFMEERGDGIIALDMCAAPGGKSTLISSIIKDRGVLVANETIKSRAKILEENIIKWGVGNTIVTSSDSENFGRLGAIFDLVVVDAPCSGEGMFRKDHASREHWSDDNVKLCAQRSRRIVANGYEALKEGGVLIYSTCTFNREEDEELMEWLVESYDVENFEIEQKEGWSMKRSKVKGVDCYKFMPHLTKGEGFFVAAIRKKESTATVNLSKSSKKPLEMLSKQEATIASRWIKESEKYDYYNIVGKIHILNKEYKDLLSYIRQHLYILYFGVEIGEIFKKEMKPSHPLALSLVAEDGVVPKIEVELDMALDFLRKNSLEAEIFDEGINIVSYKGRPLGYIKRIARRTNNLYPKEYRIINL